MWTGETVNYIYVNKLIVGLYLFRILAIPRIIYVNVFVNFALFNCTPFRSVRQIKYVYNNLFKIKLNMTDELYGADWLIILSRLANYMEQSSSWGVNSCSACQEIPRISESNVLLLWCQESTKYKYDIHVNYFVSLTILRRLRLQVQLHRAIQKEGNTFTCL
jgi:hypothetical protein